mgnify:CR=1 FL=1
MLPGIGLQGVGEVVLSGTDDDAQALVRPAVDQETVALAGGQVVEDAAGLAPGESESPMGITGSLPR